MQWGAYVADDGPSSVSRYLDALWIVEPSCSALAIDKAR